MTADAWQENPAVPGPPPPVTPRQAKAIEALLREPSVARAAVAAGVGERTLFRWLAEPGFRAAVLAARREAFGHAVGLSQRYATAAIATLVKVMNDPAAGASAKVAAANAVLRFGREGLELDDLNERVRQLEDQAANPRKVVASRQVEPGSGEDVGPADDGDDEELGDLTEDDTGEADEASGADVRTDARGEDENEGEPEDAT